MSDVLAIYAEKLKDAVEQMEAAHESYQISIRNGFTTEISNLETMNSDFTEKLTRTLEIIPNKRLNYLLIELNNYIQTAKKICEDMEFLDNGLANSMEGSNKNG